MMIGSAEASPRRLTPKAWSSRCWRGRLRIRGRLETADRLFGNALDADRAQQGLDDIAHARSAGIRPAGGSRGSGIDRVLRPRRAGARHGVRGPVYKATDPEFRGRGIYRALTAARARAALRMGKKYPFGFDAHVEADPRAAGLVAVTGTTPFHSGRDRLSPLSPGTLLRPSSAVPAVDERRIRSRFSRASSGHGRQAGSDAGAQLRGYNSSGCAISSASRGGHAGVGRQ